MKTRNVVNTRNFAVTAIMSALASVLMFIEFSIPIMPSFIKLDISDLPELITSFAFGPLWGIAVCLIKNLIHIAVTQSAGIGELSNFILGAVFVFAAGMLYKIRRNKRFALVGSVVGSALMAVAAFAVNLFIIYPLYIKFMMPVEAILGLYKALLPSVDSLWKAILIFNVPFTFAKGILISVITAMIYPKLSPVIKGKK